MSCACFILQKKTKTHIHSSSSHANTKTRNRSRLLPVLLVQLLDLWIKPWSVVQAGIMDDLADKLAFSRVKQSTTAVVVHLTQLCRLSSLVRGCTVGVGLIRHSETCRKMVCSPNFLMNQMGEERSCFLRCNSRKLTESQKNKFYIKLLVAILATIAIDCSHTYCMTHVQYMHM